MTVYDPLTRPRALVSAPEVLALPSAVPAASGVYAWYFDRLPGSLTTEGAVRAENRWLLYVGISPKSTSRLGRPSRQTLRSRLRYHYRGNAYGSTLRLSLGCLLQDELDIRLQRVGSGTRLTFAAGEARLSDWMAQHTRVTWLEHPEPWAVEHEMIAALDLPLNLDQNRVHPYHQELSAIRAQARDLARSMPVSFYDSRPQTAADRRP